MIKTEEQINSRLNSSRNLVNRFVNRIETNEVQIIPLHNPGNIEKPKLKEEQKNEIALRSRLGENQTSLAEEFNVSQSAIGEIEQGRTRVDEDLIQARLDQVQDVALTKLLESIGLISPEKLDKLKGTELSVVASNMSKVIGNVRGNNKNDSNVQVHVQVFAPEIRREQNFNTIEV